MFALLGEQLSRSLGAIVIADESPEFFGSHNAIGVQLKFTSNRLSRIEWFNESVLIAVVVLADATISPFNISLFLSSSSTAIRMI